MKKQILALLLLCFTFFIVHDYAIEAIDSDTQLELCYSQDSSFVLDLQSEIHDHIHFLLDVPLEQHPIDSKILLSTVPMFKAIFTNDTIFPVLHTPPIA